MVDVLKVDRYEAVLEKGENIAYYAICGKKKIPMPSAYKSMYTEDYLRIRKVKVDYPELFDLPSAEHYIPIRTARS